MNLEGLAPRLGESPRRPSLPVIASRLGDPDVLCFQEIGLRERDAAEVALANDTLPGFRAAFSLADDPKNARFRGGRMYGVGTYVRRELEPVVVSRQPWDREGRVVVIVLPSTRLAIVNVYAVNGTGKPYWDHAEGRVVGDRHQWKRRFHDHVADLGRTLKRADLDLLLIGDWNVTQERIDTTPRLRTEEPHATSRAHFRGAVVEGLDVVDIFRAREPERRAYTWFNPRSRRLDAARVDYALLSRSRMDDVLDASIDEDLVAELKSDHAPLHVSLRT